MSRFVQLHLLLSYPPSNPNRDDLGKPKSAVMGGVPRMRISSQSLKRAWRTSDAFQAELQGHLGTRTKRMGQEILKTLQEAGMAEDAAKTWAGQIAGKFGKLDTDGLDIAQLCHFTPEERNAIDDLAKRIAAGATPDDGELTGLIRHAHSAADVALFGRMLAARPECNSEAAAQVAHAITVHKVTMEDDFFTAVDDLKKRSDDAGSAHMGETEFAAGLFYLYVCVDCALLKANLSGDAELAKKTLAALLEAAATVAPSGMQNRFGSRVRASYVFAERGDQQPRSLSAAFLKPVEGKDMLEAAVKNIEDTAANMDKTYGACRDGEPYRFRCDPDNAVGTLAELKAFVAGAVDA